ncbi:MAG: hypothetical protein H6Q90_2412 [Deltaproteobacteria bacterium]|nr:hypothetical protein [Deltaproteobacteria bacterium]
MTRLALVCGLLVVAASPASADDGQSASPDEISGLSSTSSSIGPASGLAPISIVEGPGIKVGEGTVLHPIIGLETGFVSNAFYEDTNPRATGILRLVAQVATASLSPDRLATPASDAEIAENTGSLQYRASLRLSYDFYLSGNDSLQEQGGLGVGALFRGTIRPQSTWSFRYLENFERVIRATNFESPSRTNRDINRLQLGIQFAPQGRTLSALLHYENLIDFFEDEDQRFANRMHNTVGFTLNWRFRPVTVFFGEVTQGFFSGLGAASTKISSFPLTVATGVQTLLSLKTSIVGRVGYTNGFYSSGPNYSAVLGGLQFGYRYSETGRFTLMYEYLHQDSINANFYRDHAIKAQLEQQFAPFLLTVEPEFRIRQYQGVSMVIPGPDIRDDVILAVTAGLRYNFRKSLAAIAEYRLSSVQTDYMSAGDDPSYVRHEAVLGVRAAL